MELFNKYSRWIFMLAVVVWLTLAISQRVSLGYLYALLGGIVLFLGLKNIVLLLWASREGELPDKAKGFIESYGARKGLVIYLTLFIVFYLLVGSLLILSGIRTGL